MDTIDSFHLHRERYTINKQPVDTIANFLNETVTIHTRGFSKTFPLEDYTNFEGDMKSFATVKINE